MSFLKICRKENGTNPNAESVPAQCAAFGKTTVEKGMVEEHNKEKEFLASLSLLYTIQGNSAFPVNQHVSL